MRIISGKYKSKKLFSPEGSLVTRPTSDRVKESMFNVLQNYTVFQNLIVLDLFAGSGALGLEALSRGATQAIFIEENKQALQCLRQNISSLSSDISECLVFNQTVQNFLASHDVRFKNKIDLILADPPYSLDWYEGALDSIFESGICSKNCLFLVELPREKNIGNSKHPGNWEQLNEKTYGKTRIELWKIHQNENK